MSDRQFERAVNDWLEDGSDRTPPATIQAVLFAVKTTPQERDLRIPRRFPQMFGLSRASGIAAIALVAVIGAGALFYLNSKAPGGPGGPTTAPSTQAPTATPTEAPTPAPSEVAKGIPGWTSYTSEVYGFTLAYPSDWSLHAKATHKWQPGEPASEDVPWADAFYSGNDDTIALFFSQVPVPAGSDLESWEGLQAAYADVCEVPTFGDCVVGSPPTRMCVGQETCQPALVLMMGTPQEPAPVGILGDPDTDTISIFAVARPDNFVGAVKYGGTTALLKAILSQVGVREP